MWCCRAEREPRKTYTPTPHFTDEGAETQRGKIIFSGSLWDQEQRWWNFFFYFMNAIDVILLPKSKYLTTPTIPESRLSHNAVCSINIFNLPPIYQNKQKSKGPYQLNKNFSKSKTCICSKIGFPQEDVFYHIL